jgi:hypothetical protein
MPAQRVTTLVRAALANPNLGWVGSKSGLGWVELGRPSWLRLRFAAFFLSSHQDEALARLVLNGVFEARRRDGHRVYLKQAFSATASLHSTLQCTREQQHD